MLTPVLALAVGASGAPAAHADGRQAQADVRERVEAQRRTLVDFREQGGFAGLDNRVRMFTDGCGQFSRRTGPTVNACVTGKELRRLRGYLKKLKVGTSEPRPQGADFLRYTLTYKGRRASRYTPPATWKPVVQHLEKLLTKYWSP
ncbi:MULTISPECIES: hypothetical protein [unclassified Nonomuraea]|uniref:hypothetical protein n=1 Tax=unclassified Nonomuraea TaxID=2593643 RepID=UPI0033F1CE54